jgi:hypothetical protein
VTLLFAVKPVNGDAKFYLDTNKFAQQIFYNQQFLEQMERYY